MVSIAGAVRIAQSGSTHLSGPDSMVASSITLNVAPGEQDAGPLITVSPVILTSLALQEGLPPIVS